MELRQLDTLLAIADSGSFSGAADLLHTVQSNVSGHVQQLEKELGVPVFVRGRRGAQATEFGEVVIERARRIRAELDALLADLSMLQGLEAGHATLGVVGTASRWLVPALLAELRDQAPGLQLRVNEGASERLATEVIGRELAMAVVTEPMTDERLVVDHLLEEALIGLLPHGTKVGGDPVAFAELAALPLILPPIGNPIRLEVETAAQEQGLRLNVPIEVEGIRLIADLVAAGGGASILPPTAVPPRLAGTRQVAIRDLPPRRLALIRARDSYLSLANRAVYDAVRRLVVEHT
jgi:DNA-binding transcriptional LysR family regulator